MNRHYGIDLLKIIAMLMVVMLHVMRHGGVTEALAKNSHSISYGAEQQLNTFCLLQLFARHSQFLLPVFWLICQGGF